MRLWKTIDGVPYMVNDPRLGILGLNPKRSKKMARRNGARHMAWVRSFQKRRKSGHRRKRNPAGPVAAAMFNPRHRRRHGYRKRNPSRMRRYATQARGFFGMPPLMPIVYGAGGYVATAFINKTVFSLLPTSITTDATSGQASPLVKYAVLIGSVIATTWAAKSFLGPGAAAFAGVGGGIYLVSQAAHDFAPGMVPGMGSLDLGAYANVRAYSRIRGVNGVKGLAAPDYGATNTAMTAGDGGQNIVQSRFRRFQ